MTGPRDEGGAHPEQNLGPVSLEYWRVEVIRGACHSHCRYFPQKEGIPGVECDTFRHLQIPKGCVLLGFHRAASLEESKYKQQEQQPGGGSPARCG